MSRLPSTFLRVAVAAYAAYALLTIPQAWSQEGRPRFRPPVSSPAIDGEGNVTFRIRAPNATEIRVTSSDMPGAGQAGLAMMPGDEGVWEVTAAQVAPGAYRYRINVDGVGVVDPANGMTSESNGNVWSLVHVSGAEWMDTNNVPHGAIAEVHYYSEPLQTHRRMHVYTPPGYEAGLGAVSEPTADFPVFYLLHGAMDCDDSWSTVGRAGFILDNLIAQGKAVPMIVVMPAGHTGPFAMGRDPLPLDEFTRDFEGAIRPYIETHYRVRQDQSQRAIAGLSMGGAQTLNIAIRNLGDYAYIGVFSSGVFGIDGRGPGQNSEQPAWEETHAAALADPQLKAGIELVWFATGSEDFLLPTTLATVETLKKHEFEVTYQETDGGHTWNKWRDYLEVFGQALFQNAARDAAAGGDQE